MAARGEKATEGLSKAQRLKKSVYRLWRGPETVREPNLGFYRRWECVRMLDDAPMRFRNRFSKRKRYAMLGAYMWVWMAMSFLVLFPSFVKYPHVGDAEGNRVGVVSMNCNGMWNWRGPNNACGVNAERCGPFEGEEVIVRCPALCDSGSMVYTERVVGDQRFSYRSYVIGGGPASGGAETVSLPYRGDSHVCGSAMHAGVLSPVLGGCVRLAMTGTQGGFPASEGYRGARSIPFMSMFPSSFHFKSLPGRTYGCHDPRIPLTGLNVIYGVPVFYLYEGAIGFWVTVLVGYWNLVLGSDPPISMDPYERETVSELWSVGFQRLLPLCFILYILWRAVVSKLGDEHPVLRTLLWYPFFWLGVLYNVTLDRLPVDRLTIGDLRARPASVTVVAVIAALTLVCAGIQIYTLWRSGVLARYLKLYLGILSAVILFLAMPGLHLRLHHYILGILLLPGCATRSVPAFIFQGILVGLIISSVGRWGFASIVETNTTLARGLLRVATSPVQFNFAQDTPHSVSWGPVFDNHSLDSLESEFTDYSLLVNDIEMYVGRNTTVDIDLVLAQNPQFNDYFTLNTHPADLFLRVARYSPKLRQTGDYSDAGVLEWPQGVWRQTPLHNT